MEQRELDTKKRDKGFTLVELLIVIVILGILATVVVFAVAGVTDKAKGNACATTEKTLLTAVESARADNSIAVGSHPTLVQVEEYVTDPAIVAAAAAAGVWGYAEATGVLTQPTDATNCTAT
jgi:prepilin-type N-terminal cleavage/methylation domain-containing protein